MKEITDIVHAYDKIDKESIKLALATVIDVKGSSYRRTGARMLIQDNGIWTGGISGGCIEGNALKKANLAIINNEARVVTYDTENDDEAEIGVSLGCNGIISVLITPVDPKSPNNPIEQFRNQLKTRNNNLIITVVKSDEYKISAGSVFSDNFIDGLIDHLDAQSQLAVNEQIEKVLSSKKSTLESIGKLELFIEYVAPPIRIIIAGGNYDIVPLLEITNKLGWESFVVSSPNRLSSQVKQLANEVTKELSSIDSDPYTVAIIMGHDYNADLANLTAALKTDLKYIGLLGPAIRKEKMIQEIESNGTVVNQERVYGPAGLDIGAAQPEEIAISIVSEIISVMRDRSGTSLKERTAPIHDRD